MKMIRSLTTLLFLCSSQILFSQSFSITPNPASVSTDLSLDPNLFSIEAESTIANNTSETLNIKWVRIVNDKPDCWLTTVFDPFIVSLPLTDSGQFQLAPDDNSILNVISYLNSDGGAAFAGEANVVLEVSNLDDPSETIQVEYNFSAIGENICVTASTTEVDEDMITLSPNPVRNGFQLSNTQDVAQILVYDVAGSEVARYQALPGQIYSTEELRQGVYFLKLLDRNQELIGSKKLVKE